MNKIVVVDTYDPAFNLALEEVIFDALAPERPDWFLIWQNRPSVIIGRHQNTLEEIDQDYTQAHAIDIVRRPSGGGAVFHDLGNVNFSFLFYRDQSGIVLGEVLQPILRALLSLGIEAALSGRNDIVVNGKKVSGCAMRQSNGKHLVHGTLMLDLDLERLGKCLKGNPDKYKSKGIASVQARVANLREFMPGFTSREQGVASLTKALLAQWTQQPIPLPMEIRTAAADLARQKYGTWAWNYGQSPKFDFRNRRRFPWGSMEYQAKVEKGLITDWHLYGDFFCLKNLADLELAMLGLSFEPLALRHKLEALEAETWFVGAERDLLLDFLSNSDLS